MLGAIGVLAWRTYQYEAEMPAEPRHRPTGHDDGPAEPPEPLENPLQDPTFWNGEGQLRRAAVLHLCTGAVAAAAVPVGAVLIMDPPRGLRAAVAWPTVLLFATVVTIAVVAVGRPWLSRRQGATPLGRWSVAVAALTGLGLVGTFVLLLLPDGPAGPPLTTYRLPVGCATTPGLAGCDAARPLPGYETALAWLVTYQVLLLVAIGAANRSGRRALAGPVAAAALLPLAVVWIERGLPALPATPAGLAPGCSSALPSRWPSPGCCCPGSGPPCRPSRSARTPAWPGTAARRRSSPASAG